MPVRFDHLIKDLKVTMVVTGFPNVDEPHRSIFDLRAAKRLAEVVDLSVLYLRSWKPGRRLYQENQVDGIPVATVTVPQIPLWRNHPVVMGIDLSVYRRKAWKNARSHIARADIVHSVNVVRAGINSAEWSRRCGVHHVVHLLGSDVISVLPRAEGARVARGWHRHVHGVIAASRALATHFTKLYPEVPNVRPVYLGVDLEMFHPEGPVEGPLAARGPVRFAYFGGFPKSGDTPGGRAIKGGEALLAAWAQAEERIEPSVSLLVAGPGAGAHWVARWRRSLKYPERVFTQGAIDPQRMPSYMRATDAVVLPSLEEGLPNVAVEAAACGRATLASNVWGNPEIVLPDRNGTLVTANNTIELSKALVGWSRDTEMLHRFGIEGRRIAESRFDGRRYPANALEMYRDALSQPIHQGR